MRTTWTYLATALLAGVIGYAAAQKVPPGPPPSLPILEEGRPQVEAAEPNQPPATELADLPEVSPEEAANMRVYQRANRSVVNITTRSLYLDDFLLFSGPREGSGSGSVLDRQGHILTNYHVIENARQVAVTLFDGSSHPARLVGHDPNNDLAVLKIEVEPNLLTPLAWGDSSKLRVGMRVFAIGNPFGLERTLTTGIVSSLNRSLRSENNRLIRGVIQTDAAINPGNSGGPLLNRRGEMVGITTAIVSRAGQNSGIGLAIPANPARRIVDDLIRHGRVLRPDCGIFSVYEVDDGLLIGRLVPDGPAERAGLRGPRLVVVRRGGIEYRGLDRSRADLIIAVDGRRVRTLDELLSYIERGKPGDKVLFTIIREGQRMEIPVELELSRD